jgi:hypothetical protein
MYGIIYGLNATIYSVSDLSFVFGVVADDCAAF